MVSDFGGAGFTGVYRANTGGSLGFDAPDQFGSDAAPGGRHIVTAAGAGYSLALASTLGQPVTYPGICAGLS